MKTITCIIGTRPQLIKHSALLSELKKLFIVHTVNTLQHYQEELNEVFINDLYPDVKFGTVHLSNSNTPSMRLGEMIVGISGLLKEAKSGCVLVYGDTDSTLAAALAASKNNIPLVHIEAGERSFNKQMPEEVNRLLTDVLSEIHFCSSVEAIENLKKEGITKNVFFSGDVMKDLLVQKKSQLNKPADENYIFCTIHRNYTKNNQKKLRELLKALSQIKKRIIFPVHPSTIQNMAAYNIDLNHYPAIQVLPPLPYMQSLSYQKFSEAVITDSGGIQKEAYWLKKPCITIRKETEWKRTLAGKWNQLLYDNLDRLPELLNVRPAEDEYDEELYGNGNASVCISETLLKLI